MSHCPNTPAQHEAEGPQISAFNYLDGFLHGFTAASTTKGKVFAGPSLPALDTPWPLLSYPALPQQELYSFTSNVSIQNDVRVSAPSYPQSFPRIIDDELPQPVVSPGSTSSSFYQHISQNDSLPLENRERLSVSDEVVNSFPCQPFLVPGNLQFVSLPALAGSQYVGPALYEPEIFASRLDEGPVALLHKSATIRDQPGNVVDTYAFPTAEIGVPLQSWEQLGGKSTLGNANLKEQAVSPRSSAVDALRCSQSLEAPVSWVCLLPGYLLLYLHEPQPVAVSTKRVAPDAGQTVFRAYGTKRSRFSEKSRTSTARTRELGACEACRKKKIRVSLLERFQYQSDVPSVNKLKKSLHLAGDVQELRYSFCMRLAVALRSLMSSCSGLVSHVVANFRTITETFSIQVRLWIKMPLFSFGCSQKKLERAHFSCKMEPQSLSPREEYSSLMTSARPPLR